MSAAGIMISELVLLVRGVIACLETYLGTERLRNLLQRPNVRLEREANMKSEYTYRSRTRGAIVVL